MADLDAELRSRLARLAESVPVAPWLGHVEPRPVAARGRLRMAWVTPAVAIAAVLLGTAVLDVASRPGATSSPGTSPSGPSNGIAHSSTRSGHLLLEIESSKSTYGPGEPIEITASLINVGFQPVTIGHALGAGQSALSFGIEEPVLGDLRLGPGFDTACATTTLAPGKSVAQPFQKSAGWSSDHPRSAEYRAFVEDPELRLAPGAWHVFVVAWFSPGECSRNTTEMRVQIEITVVEPNPPDDSGRRDRGRGPA